jgi:bacterioferritin
MSVTEVPGDSLDGSVEDEHRGIIKLLTSAYWMEIETVTNYIAASMGGDGARGVAVRAALAAGIEEEVEHARALGRRIQELQRGVVPGTEPFAGDEHQPHPERPTDLSTMIEAVLATETSAIRHYQRIIQATAHIDEDTNALALGILRDEQRHLRLFSRYRRELRA